MISLHTNRAQGDGRILCRICLVAAANLVAWVLAKIVNDFAIEHRIFVQVNELRPSRCCKLLLFFDLFQSFLVSGSWSLNVLNLGELFLVACNSCLGVRCGGTWCYGSTSVELGELSLKLLVFCSEFSDELVLRALVDFGRVFNLFGSIGVFKGVKRFFVVVDTRTDGGDHDRGRITTECLGEHSGERGVAIGHDNFSSAGAVLGKRRNHITECGQRQIDCVTFSETITARLGLAGLLGTSQINQVDLRGSLALLALGVGNLDEFKGENGVGSAASTVHGGSFNCTVLIAERNPLLDLFVVFNDFICNSFDVDVSFVLTNLEGLTTRGFSDKEVLDLLHVNLNHMNGHFKCDIWVGVGSDSLENSIGSHWNDTTVGTISEHSVGLT